VRIGLGIGEAAVLPLIDTTGTYSSAFLLTAAVSVGGALFYSLFGSAQPIEGLEIRQEPGYGNSQISSPSENCQTRR
jgi:hypothetical protein